MPKIINRIIIQKNNCHNKMEYIIIIKINFKILIKIHKKNKIKVKNLIIIIALKILKNKDRVVLT